MRASVPSAGGAQRHANRVVMSRSLDCVVPGHRYLHPPDPTIPRDARHSDATTLVRPDVPAELANLLSATDPADREVAWAAVVARHTRLLLHVARAVVGADDAAMDAYTYLLERLRDSDLRRLRSFSTEGRGSFTTWLVVVARRLCVDFRRQRYGRATRALRDPESGAAERQARRRLVDLAARAIDLNTLVDRAEPDPERAVREFELYEALRESIRALPPHDRLLLKLRFEDDLAASEIATLLRYPTPFHVYRQLNRLLDDLRVQLRRRGVTSALP